MGIRYEIERNEYDLELSKVLAKLCAVSTAIKDSGINLTEEEVQGFGEIIGEAYQQLKAIDAGLEGLPMHLDPEERACLAEFRKARTGKQPAHHNTMEGGLKDD